MQYDPDNDEYQFRVSEYVSKYETLTFEQVHSDVLDLLPQQKGVVLDIGAGSGRDAAWFAASGWEVIAIDKSSAMLESARRLHPDPRIIWMPDSLPGLQKTFKKNIQFDLIWLSAVWMHVPPKDRARAFRKMVALLNSSGWIMISLRHGSFADGRSSYEVSVDELDKLAQQHGLVVRRVCSSSDRFNRDAVSWEWICMQLPDDGTEALPLLRHTILRDSKSSTYKLALLRVLVRIADSATGIAREVDDDNNVAVPLGLVALYWIRMFKPLVESKLPQAPPNEKQTGLGFVKEAFLNLRDCSPYDLAVGQSFRGGNAKFLLEALIDARNTICKMPAYYIRYPHSDKQVFCTASGGRIKREEHFILDADLFWQFGELRIPRNIWFAMCRFASWIEPSLMTEWIRLMQTYAMKAGSAPTYDELIRKLIWIEPERDTGIVRDIATKLVNSGKPLYCVWSGKKLNGEALDIDHCFPFSAWPCSDLWNLMPSARAINQNQKSDKLISSATLQKAGDRIIDWWNNAYLHSDELGLALGDRFNSEAKVSLPISNEDSVPAPEQVLEGMLIKRVALKRDLQIPDWNF